MSLMPRVPRVPFSLLMAQIHLVHPKAIFALVPVLPIFALLPLVPLLLLTGFIPLATLVALIPLVPCCLRRTGSTFHTCHVPNPAGLTYVHYALRTPYTIPNPFTRDETS